MVYINLAVLSVFWLFFMPLAVRVVYFLFYLPFYFITYGFKEGYEKYIAMRYIKYKANILASKTNTLNYDTFERYKHWHWRRASISVVLFSLVSYLWYLNYTCL